jgi:hypothetical protein
MRTEDVLNNHELEPFPPPHSGLVQQYAAANGSVTLSLAIKHVQLAIAELLSLIWQDEAVPHDACSALREERSRRKTAMEATKHQMLRVSFIGWSHAILSMRHVD